MTEKLQKKLAKLPKAPGVYFHKNETGEIIYIGKAANLRNRVRQYFQKTRAYDAKTEALVSEISDVDWTEVETEVDALFLEAELVKRYMPRYNILLRDDKSLEYVRIDYKSDYPTVSFIRRPLDDGAEYFGPYINGFAVKKALRYLRRAFPYAVSRPVGQKRASLHYHIGLDPGLEDGRTSLNDYRANLRKLIQYLRGNRVALVNQIQKDMKAFAKASEFEKAALARNQLFALQSLARQVIFSDHEIQEASRDQALVELSTLLALKQPPKRIEAFDISHIQGTDTAASMVVFASGVPNKAAYRKFKMRKPGNDDFAHMFEAVTRRLSETNVKKWGLSELILIDGGKGQLSAAIAARDQAGYSRIAMIGLAKRFEELIIHKSASLTSLTDANWPGQAQKLEARLKLTGDFVVISLPSSSHLIKLLQRIRDESHRFAVSYHTTLRRSRQTASLLDEVPGIGPATRKKLIKSFGSLRAISLLRQQDIAKVIGEPKAAILRQYLDFKQDS